MKRKRLWIVVLLAMTAVAAIIFFTTRPDPRLVYKGRSLSDWLAAFGSTPIRGGLTHSHLAENTRWNNDSAIAAIRVIGTNALGPLMKEIQRRDDPGWLAATKHFLEKRKLLKPVSVMSRREQAAIAIFELGTNALPVLPELARLLTNYSTATAAAHALAGMGPAAVPAFQAALTNGNTWIQDCGVWGLAQIGAASSNAVPFVLPLLRVSNSADTHITTWALGEIREPRELVVPALIKMLAHTDTGVRGAATRALAKFDSAMTNQLPELRLALEQESDPSVQKELRELIKDLENPKTDVSP